MSELRQVEPGWLQRSLESAEEAINAMTPATRSNYRSYGWNVKYNRDDVLYAFAQEQHKIDQTFWLRWYINYLTILADDSLLPEERDIMLAETVEIVMEEANKQLQNRKDPL